MPLIGKLTVNDHFQVRKTVKLPEATCGFSPLIDPWGPRIFSRRDPLNVFRERLEVDNARLPSDERLMTPPGGCEVVDSEVTATKTTGWWFGTPFIYPRIWNFIIHTDEVFIFFSEGVGWNHQLV